MGHTHCGAVHALVEGIDDEDVAPWLSVAQNACARASQKVSNNEHEALLRETEKETVIESVNNVLDYPVVQKAVQDGRIEVHGWLFAMDSGDIHELDQEHGTFSVIDLNTYATDAA